MIMEALIIDFLDKNKITYTKTGTNFVMCSCLNPKHVDKKPSFSLNLSTGYGICFGCQYTVTKDFWLYDQTEEEAIENINRDIMYRKIEETFRKKEEKVDLFLPPTSEHRIPTNWRGLNEQTITKNGIYYCDYGHFEDRIIFPMKNYDGEVTAFNSRAVNEPKVGMQKYKYSKGIKVNELVYPPLLPNKNYVVLVEGILDALSMQQEGIPALLNFGVNMTFGDLKIAHLIRNNITTIYIALDNDEAGFKGTLNYLHSNLREFFLVKVGQNCPDLTPFYESECKDYNEFLQKK